MECVIAIMKNLRHLILIFGAILIMSVCAMAQQQDEKKNPPPPKSDPPKVRVEPKDPPPRQNPPNNGGDKGDKNKKPGIFFGD